MKQQLTRSHLTESCTETTKFNLHGTKKQLVTWAPTQSHTRETERGHRVSPLMLRLVCFCAGRCCGDGLIPGDPRRSPPLGIVVSSTPSIACFIATAKYRLVAGYSDLISVSRRTTVQAWCTRVEKVVEVSRARYHDYQFSLCKQRECVITTRSFSQSRVVKGRASSVTAPIETNTTRAVSVTCNEARTLVTVTAPDIALYQCLKQDTPSSSGRAAPLLAEPRFGAGPQPYSE
uniref:Uncharacterized protein n=1 Tax=Timema douglasi TaxID=61478 RepID=A0A7R8V8S8_TIMDO|nr:unnamed protein product [Timema douglasi]